MINFKNFCAFRDIPVEATDKKLKNLTDKISTKT